MSEDIAKARALAAMLVALAQPDDPQPMYLSKSWVASVGDMILVRLPEVSAPEAEAARRFMAAVFIDIPPSKPSSG